MNGTTAGAVKGVRPAWIMVTPIVLGWSAPAPASGIVGELSGPPLVPIRTGPVLSARALPTGDGSWDFFVRLEQRRSCLSVFRRIRGFALSLLRRASVGLLLLFFSLWAEGAPPLSAPVLPVRIGGTLLKSGVRITRSTETSLRFYVTRPDGSPLVPKAESSGLNASDSFILDIPAFEKTSQPEGGRSGERARIHVVQDELELAVASPADGLFTIGDPGSTTPVDLVVVAKEKK